MSTLKLLIYQAEASSIIRTMYTSWIHKKYLIKNYLSYDHDLCHAPLISLSPGVLFHAAGILAAILVIQVFTVAHPPPANWVDAVVINSNHRILY